MNSVKPALLGLLLLLGAAPGAFAQSSGSGAPAARHAEAASAGPTHQEPAAWIPHDVMVAYQNLPQAYSCDALWHKVGDMLRAVGAWKAVSITPYDCKPSTRSDGRSPQLEVRFLTLRPVAPQNARWAQAMVAPKTVVLEPGHPPSLAPGDCELLEQTQQDLLSLVPSWQVAGGNLQCSSAKRAPYHLAVKTLIASAAK